MGQAGNVPPRMGKKRRGEKLNKNNGHGADHKYGRIFSETTCPACRHKMRGSVTGRVSVCGKCNAPIPRLGYVAPLAPSDALE